MTDSAFRNVVRPEVFFKMPVRLTVLFDKDRNTEDLPRYFGYKLQMPNANTPFSGYWRFLCYVII